MPQNLLLSGILQQSLLNQKHCCYDMHWLCSTLCTSHSSFSKNWRYMQTARNIMYYSRLINKITILGYINHNMEESICDLKLNNLLWVILITYYLVMTLTTIICYAKIYKKHAEYDNDKNLHLYIRLVYVLNKFFFQCAESITST